MGSQRTFASLQMHADLSMLHLNWKLLILQENVELHQRFKSCQTFCEFWKLVPKQEFSVCCMVASKVAAYFGSSCLCEQAFSVMKTLKSKTRNCLSSEHLCDQMRTCLSAYQARLDALTSSMHCQTSHLQTGGLVLADYIKHYCYSLSRQHSIINNNNANFVNCVNFYHKIASQGCRV